MATSKKIVSIFCGNFASVTEQDELKVVVCSNCKRETELDTYQEMFDQWVDKIRDEE